MTRRIILSRGAEKDLRSIVERATLRRLSNSIEALAGDLCPPGTRKLGGVSAVWRIRVGDWRICYAIEADESIVVILTIARRGDVYERLRRRLEKGTVCFSAFPRAHCPITRLSLFVRFTRNRSRRGYRPSLWESRHDARSPATAATIARSGARGHGRGWRSGQRRDRTLQVILRPSLVGFPECIGHGLCLLPIKPGRDQLAGDGESIYGHLSLDSTSH